MQDTYTALHTVVDGLGAHHQAFAATLARRLL